MFFRLGPKVGNLHSLLPSPVADPNDKLDLLRSDDRKVEANVEPRKRFQWNGQQKQGN